MPTEKLYWVDPFATVFEAGVVAVANHGDRPSLVLDRTLFYPEAGGQLADVGELTVDGRAIAIDDVQIDDEGTIHHLAAALGAFDAFEPSPPRVASGRIDARRRRDHMAQHTGQHMLSRALQDEARAETVSSRLGATTCTIDLGRGAIPDAEIARAEELVNAAIRDDLGVRTLFPTPDELALLPLRRAPKVTSGVRIIDIDGFDVSPCGGTHCTRTGQIGLVRVVATEKYKGMTRVTFHAGARALADMRMKDRVLADLARDFTCGPLDVPSGVAKLRADVKARLDALSAVRGELVAYLAADALSSAPPDPSGTTLVVLERTGDDIGMLRTLAARLSARVDVVAFCATPDAGSDGDLLVVAQRGSAATFDCGAWFKTVAAAHGGRGGGRPERAEGRLARGVDLRALALGSTPTTP